MPAARRLASNASATSPESMDEVPPRGLRLKICMAVQDSRTARATASSSPPAIGTWTPNRMWMHILSPLRSQGNAVFITGGVSTGKLTQRMSACYVKTLHVDGAVAQLGERHNGIVEATGSIPVCSIYLS